MNVPDNMTLQATVQGAGTGARKRQTISPADKFSWPGRIAILAAIVFSPWIFGSVENWAQQWITICLLVATAFWWFETAFYKSESQVFPTIFFVVASGLVLGVLQTVPLPDVVAESVLGRQISIYADFLGDPNARPSASLDHDGTWGQVRLLMIALLGLVLGCRYFRSKRDIVLLMSVVSVNGALISFFGIIHKLTTNGKMFWFHEVALGGAPFGPFVNRNNGGGYLLMCLACCIGLLPIVMSQRKKSGPRTMISTEIPFWRQLSLQFLDFVSELTAAKLAVIFGVALIASGVVSSLSRGAVVAMLGGGLGTLLVYGMARRPKNFAFVILPFLLLIVALSSWIGFWDELGNRFDRVDVANVEEADTRIQHWKDTWPAVREMGWLGSGLGSYRGVHRLYRVDNEVGLFHYAENQYFQSLVEAGAIGLLLFLAAWVLAYQYTSLAIYRGNSATTIGVGTMGLFLVFSQAIASVFDFGLYITANMLLMSVLVGFLAYHGQSLAGRLKRGSWLRFELPNYIVQFVVLVLFAGGTMVALDLHRRAKLDKLMVPRVAEFGQRPLDLKEVDEKMSELAPLVQRTPTVASLNYAGELWLYRSRLEILESRMEKPAFIATTSAMTEEEKSSYIEKFWRLTGIQRVQENADYLRREGTGYEVNAFLESSAIRENLPQAESCFYFSNQRSPLQPWVHLRIGEVKAVIGKPGEGDVDIERALRLAPGNGQFHEIAAVYYLQSGNIEAAAEHFRKCLELRPKRYSVLIAMIKGRNYRNVATISDEMIIENIIPDDPRMLYLFATTYLDPNGTSFGSSLKKAADLLGNVDYKLRDDLVLLGNIRVEQGDLVAAVELFKLVLRSNPDTPKIRYQRAKILIELGKLDDALKEAEYLKNRSSSSTVHNQLLEEVRGLIHQRDHP